jgi:hypothetical protein
MRIIAIKMVIEEPPSCRVSLMDAVSHGSMLSLILCCGCPEILWRVLCFILYEDSQITLTDTELACRAGRGS